jgi:hypothetical protein
VTQRQIVLHVRRADTRAYNYKPASVPPILGGLSRLREEEIKIFSLFKQSNRSETSFDFTVVYAFYLFFFSCGSTVLLDPGRLTYRRFLDLFRHMVGLLGRVISPSQGLYLHRTTQHRNTRTNIHTLSGIRTHDPINQLAKTHASDRTATVTGVCFLLAYFISQSKK